MIHTIVIDLNPECRAKWLTTVDMDDDDLEAFEQREILNEQRREQEQREQRERARLEAWREAQPRAIIGHDRGGNPVYDNASGMVTNWGISGRSMHYYLDLSEKSGGAMPHAS